jgi:hypothetical protein
MQRIAVLLAFVIACDSGNSAKEQAMKDIERDRALRGDEGSAATKKMPVKDPEVKKDKPPPDPEPTTPKEIEDARKKAMIEGRDKDVIRFCEMGKVGETTSAQVLLGCALAACRLNQGDKASAWARSMKNDKKDGKALTEQAIKTCQANKVVLSLQ